MGVWREIPHWFQQYPETMAPDSARSVDTPLSWPLQQTSLWTLHRRVKQWRGVDGKKLVYPSGENSEFDEVRRGYIGPVGDNYKPQYFGNYDDAYWAIRDLV